MDTRCTVCGAPLSLDGYCDYHQPTRINESRSTHKAANTGSEQVKELRYSLAPTTAVQSEESPMYKKNVLHWLSMIVITVSVFYRFLGIKFSLYPVPPGTDLLATSMAVPAACYLVYEYFHYSKFWWGKFNILMYTLLVIVQLIRISDFITN